MYIYAIDRDINEYFDKQETGADKQETGVKL